MPDLSTHIRNIGEAQSFPDWHNDEQGMTYRQWLIGQALSNCASPNSMYAYQNAKSAIAHADEVIKLLAEEVAEEERPTPKREKVELVSISVDRS